MRHMGKEEFVITIEKGVPTRPTDTRVYAEPTIKGVPLDDFNKLSHNQKAEIAGEEVASVDIKRVPQNLGEHKLRIKSKLNI